MEIIRILYNLELQMLMTGKLEYISETSPLNFEYIHKKLTKSFFNLLFPNLSDNCEDILKNERFV